MADLQTLDHRLVRGEQGSLSTTDAEVVRAGLPSGLM